MAFKQKKIEKQNDFANFIKHVFWKGSLSQNKVHLQKNQFRCHPKIELSNISTRVPIILSYSCLEDFKNI